MNYETHPLVKNFLDHACRKIFSRTSRQEVRQELLNHLEESVENKISAGMIIDQAIEQSLLDLGSPDKLSHELSLAHRPIYFQLPFLSAFIGIIAVIGTFLILDLTHRTFEKIERQNKELDEVYLGRFFEDQGLLNQIPFFGVAGRKSDAGVFLNTRLAWLGATELARYIPKDPSLAISSDFFSHLSTKDWISYTGDLPIIDTRWMAELKKYDHWDVFISGPILAILKDNPQQPFVSLPLPNIGSLTRWTELRLLQGVRERKVLAALKDVRQVAWLSRTTELLIGEMVGIAILRQELDTYNYAVAHGLLNASDWQPLSDEILIRARRSIYGFNQFFDIWTDPQVLAKVFDGHTARAGICTALGEGLARGSLYRAFLETPMPFEEDFSARFSLLDSAVERSKQYCRFDPVNIKLGHEPEKARGWLMPVSTSGYDNPSLWTKFVYRYLIRVPVLRRFILARLQAAVPADYIFHQYQNLLPGEPALPRSTDKSTSTSPSSTAE